VSPATRLLLRTKDFERKTPPKLREYYVHAVSVGNFPAAARLASSASGFAPLVPSIAQVCKLPKSPTELPKVARQVSGRPADHCPVHMPGDGTGGGWEG